MTADTGVTMNSKTILITGSSSGFGKLSIPLLLERGHTVIAALRGGQSRLESVLGKELLAYPGRLVALDLHMERPETFAAARALIDARFGGRLDVLVNNAGYGLFGALEDQAPDQLRHQFEVNFFGPALLTRELLPQLRAARGRVINLSSIAGLCSFPFYASYSATKFALEGLTEGMWFELRDHGVQVTLIEPGAFRTDFSTRSRQFGAGVEGAARATSAYAGRTEGLRRALVATPGRLADPMQVARLIASCCERPRLPLRIRVGKDAAAIALLRWILPSTWRVWLVDRAFRMAGV